jgi:hypothetical protein
MKFDLEKTPLAIQRGRFVDKYPNMSPTQKEDCEQVERRTLRDNDGNIVCRFEWEVNPDAVERMILGYNLIGKMLGNEKD